MTKTEALVRSVLGSNRKNIRSFSLSIDLIIQKALEHNCSFEDFPVTKEIYTEVAKGMNKDWKAVSKQVERITFACWKSGDRARLNEIVGYELQYKPRPSELMCYFAAFSLFGAPYRQAAKEEFDKKFAKLM